MQIIPETQANLSVVDLIKETLKNKKNRKILEKIDSLSEKNSALLKSLLDFYTELSSYFTNPDELKEMIIFLNESSLNEILSELPLKDREQFTNLTNITII